MIVLLSVWIGLSGRGSAEPYAPKSWREWSARLDAQPVSLGPRPRAVEIGAADNPLCLDCLQIDLRPFENGVAQVFADARRLPLADASVDVLFTVNLPWMTGHLFALHPEARAERRAFVHAVIREIHRVLRPGAPAFLLAETIDFADGSLETPLVKMGVHAGVLDGLGAPWSFTRPVLIEDKLECVRDAEPPLDQIDPSRRARWEILRRRRFDRFAGHAPRPTSTYLQGLVMRRAGSHCPRNLVRP